MTNITADEYQQACLRTANFDLDSEDQNIAYAMGLAGESGEYANEVKKIYYHGHPEQKERIKDELGDVAWYLAVSAYSWGIPLSEILEGNLKKLRQRYPDGFEEIRSINRDTESL